MRGIPAGDWKANARLAALAFVITAVSCGDQGPTVSGSETAGTLPPGLSISEPVGTSGSGGGPSLAAKAQGLVYISASPGTFPDGVSATVTNLATGERVTTTIEDGGFDPISITGSTDDELEIVVTNTDGSTTALRLHVPRRKKPKVVRTRPPAGQTDVVLNATLAVVFSEPVDESTVTPGTVQLLRNGESVESSLSLSVDGLRAELTPNAPLAAGTAYKLLVTTSVADLAGDSLEAEIQVGFVTENALAAHPAIAYVISADSSDRLTQDTDFLMVMAGDGRHNTEVYRAPVIATPSWSPLGQGTADAPYSIVFRRDEGQSVELWVIDIVVAESGAAERLGEARRLTSSCGSKFQAGPAFSGCQPAWSPDGELIAFAEGDTDDGGSSDPRSSIWVIPATGCAPGSTDPRCARPLVDAVPKASIYYPTWTPSGDRIAFLLWQPAPEDTIGTVSIVIVDSSTGSELAKIRLLDHNLDYIWNLDWARTGNVLTFDGLLLPPGSLPGRTVMTWHFDGNRNLGGPNPIMQGIHPTWSPSDKRILLFNYLQDRLVTIKSDGTGTIGGPLVNGALEPDWRRSAVEPTN